MSRARRGTKTCHAFIFTVTLSSVSTVPVTVSYATSPGTAIPGYLYNDYVSTTGALTFAPGETVKTVTVQVVGDREKERDETFYVNLSDPMNAVLTDALAVGTIRKDGDNQLFGYPAG